MNLTNDYLNILAIGLDSSSIEVIKKSFRENKLKYQISFLNHVEDIMTLRKKKVNAVFFYSNRQSQKTIDDIRKINQLIPGSAITLLSPRPENSGIISSFRAGLFDFLTLPLDKNEVRTVIYRLKMFGAIQVGLWTPERAVLHLFSRPESFSRVSDVASALNQYLEFFFQVEKDIHFNSTPRIVISLQKKLNLTEHQGKRIRKFLADETGLIFGLRYHKGRFYFLVKRGEGKVSYLVVRNKSDYVIKDILSDYLSNILKATLSIISETKKRNDMRTLALTDEVTGLYNQRKLIEDLELYIQRYKHDQVGFSLLFIDIDYFKNVNDQFGHVIGSQLLSDMARVVKNELRSTDLVYRYGGDEFIVLLPRTKLDESKNIAIRISEAVKNSEFTIEFNKKYRLSLSIGISEFPTDADTAKAIIEFADKMMYMSKKTGRGKVFHLTEVIH